MSINNIFTVLFDKNRDIKEKDDIFSNKSLMIRLVTRLIFFVLNISLIFISAGRVDYWQGWVFCAFFLIFMIISTFILSRNIDLFKERLKPGPNIKPWDKVFIMLYIPLSTLIMIVSSLDSGRFLWTSDYPLYAYVGGYLLLIIGITIILSAINTNNYFSSMVRIQSDRGHKVVQEGLYQFIRHPGYTGMIITFFAIPLVFGSLWGLLSSLCMLVLIIIRTYLEDKTLQTELEGYKEYCHKTKFRLLPCVW